MTNEERTACYAEKLAEMIRMKTVSAYNETDLTRFREFHGLLRSLFPNVFGKCEVEDFDGSLLIKWQGSGDGKPIMLMNHHDVVEAGGKWEHGAFSGDIVDGKMYGRGTLDTKSGLFCILQTVDELIADGYVPERDVYIESSCNEECDGRGADAISTELERRGVRFEYTLDEGGYIVNDPIGGADGLFAMIGVAEKGCAEMKFVAKSNGGHASKPGKNSPLVRLGKFMTAVEKKDPFVSYCPPATKEMFLRVSRKTHGITRFFLTRSRWFLAHILPIAAPSSAYLMKTTLAFTMAGGSDAANVLPLDAWVMGNMRYSHHQGRDSSFAAVKKIADKYGVEMVVTDPGVPSKLSSYTSDAFRLIESGVGRFFSGVVTAPYVAAAASDNRYMSRISDACYGFIPFIISDEQLDSIHGLNENVDLSNLVPAVDFYKYIIREGK